MLRHPGHGKHASRLILSLCDYSGRWSQPYREAGYEVRQYDLKHGSDVRMIKKIDQPVHGVLAAPLCTAFAGSGARWWKEKEAQGDEQLKEGLALVDACLRIVFVHKPVWWVLENPVGRLKDWIGHHRHTFNPFEYAGWLGDESDEEAYSKLTCLWGHFVIPKKRPVENTQGSKMWACYGGKSERTKEARSMTPRGFSRAFFAVNP
jgi:hypothetical protein